MEASEGAMLAGLIRQAEEEGADLVTLRALVEEASELGAGRALRRCGLADASAAGDLSEMRQFVQAWRDAKRAARNALVAWVTRGAFAALVALAALKLGVAGLLKA
jgi:ABC-type branched-subunit amino acid transport system substrate-binding protein